jgi:phosphinothricin acetyltransferase
MIRNATVEDAPQICEIYNHYVLHTPITFEENSISVDDMRQRIQRITPAMPWLTLEQENRLIGYCYAHPWKERAAYRFTVELTIYLDSSAVSRGKGSELFGVLLEELRTKQIHSAISVVALPNPASAGLLEKFGFHQAARFEEVGFKFGRWIDVGYWQRKIC